MIKLTKSPLIATLIFGLLTIGVASVFFLATSRTETGKSACGVSSSPNLASFVKGEIAALTLLPVSRPMPDLHFFDGQGQERSVLSWRGRWVLLNLWASWCAPCRQEMPELDHLQALLGADSFEVVAVNIDTRDLDKSRNWYRDHYIQHLAFYADPSAKIFQLLKQAGLLIGMPTTLLLDPQGCATAVLHGPAHWGGEDAVAFLRVVFTQSY